MITIEGLNKKQRLFADLMWSMNGKDEVEAFIRSLPKRDREQAQVVCEMMILAMFDEVNTVEPAVVELINSFKE